jgi:outer membrane protein assembly factor BamB
MMALAFKLNFLLSLLWYYLIKYKFIILVLSLLFVFVSGTLVVLGLQVYRSRYVTTLLRPEVSFPLHLSWEAKLGDFTDDAPAYQAGLMLMSAKNGSRHDWYGLDAASGKVVWIQNIKATSFRHCLTPDYLVLSSPWSFMALSTRTGEIIWKNEVSYGTTCSDQMVFSTGVPRDSIEAANLTTGQRLWGPTTPRKSFSGIAYNPVTDELIAMESNVPENLYIIDAKSGQLKYSFNRAVYAPNDGDNSRGQMYVVDRGELFVGGTVQDAQTGRIIHKEDRFHTAVAPIVTENTMYLSALYDGVVAFDRSTYEVKWIYPSPQRRDGSGFFHTLSQVAILDGLGYVIFSDATVRAFDLETGREVGYWQPDENDLWDWPVCTDVSLRFECIASARAGLGSSEDTLFVSFGDGKLYAFGK